MANKSLTDLTARTATADSDLIHVNSGGTDYKQAKSDFTKDIVTKITFNNTSLLTSQVEALPNQNYTGYISSAGHVTQTGVPEDTYYWVFVYKLGANNIRIEIRELAPAGHSYHNTKTTQGWSGWILDPTREEITSLNNSLTYKSYSVPVTSNAYVSPFSYYASFSITADKASYGTPIAVNVTGGQSGNNALAKMSGNSVYVYSKSEETFTVYILYCKESFLTVV